MWVQRESAKLCMCSTARDLMSSASAVGVIYSSHRLSPSFTAALQELES